MSVQKKSLISSRAVDTKVAKSFENSTSIGESKPLQASALTGRRLSARAAKGKTLKAKK